MKSTLTLLKNLVLSVILAGIFVACGNDNSGKKIEVELIEAKTELPAKVRLFYKVDLGEDNLFETLTPANFEIYEDGSLISSLESQAQIQKESGEFLFSSILLLDLSGSVLNGTELPRVKSAAIDFVESVMPVTSDAHYGAKEMAVYWFDGEEDIHELVSFSPNRNTIIDGINSITEDISADNSTNLNGAIIQGLAVVDARLAQSRLNPNISTAGSMVIFTDGTDQAGRVKTTEAQKAVNNASNEHSIFTIGLGAEIDEEVLKNFGRDGYELAENSFDLNTSFLSVAQKVESEANSYYVLEYCSPKRSGQHTIQLRVNYEKMFGSFSTKFTAQDFTGGCTID